MIHYIYKITCLCGNLKGHYYIGKHTAQNENDGYVGSGIKIRAYYKKYGAKKGETYIKEIIEYNDTAEQNSVREKEIIGDLWKTDPLCLNLMEGGKSSGMKGKKHTQEWINKRRGQPAWNKGKRATEEAVKNQSIAHMGQVPWNKGKPMSEQQKKKMSEIKKGAQYSRAKKVLQYDTEGNLIKEWHSTSFIENEIGYNHSNICNCCNGKLSQAYGYIWKYAA